MSRLTIVVAAALSILSTAACTQSSPHSGETAAASAAALRVTYGDVVGKWRFVYTDERRAAVEAQLAGKITDPIELAAAKEEAAKEAAASEIELTSDQEFISRIDGTEILRDSFSVKEGADERTLDVSSARNASLSFPVVLRDANTLVITDPKKGPLVFARAR